MITHRHKLKINARIVMRNVCIDSQLADTRLRCICSCSYILYLLESAVDAQRVRHTTHRSGNYYVLSHYLFVSVFSRPTIGDCPYLLS